MAGLCASYDELDSFVVRCKPPIRGLERALVPRTPRALVDSADGYVMEKTAARHCTQVQINNPTISTAVSSINGRDSTRTFRSITRIPWKLVHGYHPTTLAGLRIAYGD